MRRITAFFCALALWVGMGSVALAGETRVTWHGHATFQVVTPNGTVFLIDPWLTNPKNPVHAEGGDALGAIGKVDYILLTHGHFDHVGDAVSVARRTGARLISGFELGQNLAKLQGFPKEQMGFDTLINPGGEIAVADGEVLVAMTPAVHSSGLGNPFADENQPDHVYGGAPGGFVLEIQGGPTLYASGDTAYFSAMALIGKRFKVTVALVNIGGHFGMEAPMGARAAKAVRAKYAVAHHYGTFPVLTPDTEGFQHHLKKTGVRFLDLAPGETVVFDGTKPVR